MSNNINHVGVVRANGRKCVVVYRTLPGDAFNCVIVPTESLPDTYHDALMRVVESNAGQSAFHLSEVLDRSTFPDGSNMLASLHAKRFFVPLPTDAVEMIPNPTVSISLAELNHQIAQIQGVSVQDLAIKPLANDPKVEEVAQVHDMKTHKPVDEPLSDEQLANKYRKDAAQLLAEAARLQKMADDINPPAIEVPVVSEPVVTIPEVSEPVPEPSSLDSALEENKSNTAANRRRSK